MTTNNTMTTSVNSSNEFILPSASNTERGAVIKNGEIYIRGHRNNGSAGNGVLKIYSHEPYSKVSGLHNIVSLMGDSDALTALDSKGNLYGWGDDYAGSTGVSAGPLDRPILTPRLVMSHVSQAAQKASNGYAIDKDGDVWGWGVNRFMQLTQGYSSEYKPVPISIHGEHARLVCTSGDGALVISHEGHVWGFGSNTWGKLGMWDSSQNAGYYLVPIASRGLNLEPYAKQIIQMSLGHDYGIALLDDGRLIGWGTGYYLGVHSRGSHFEPVVIMDNVAKFHAAYFATAVLTKDGAIYTFGGGGALYMFQSVKPVQCLPAGSAIDIGGSKESIFYRSSNGRVYGVGSNRTGTIKQTIYGAVGSTIKWPGEEIELSAELNP